MAWPFEEYRSGRPLRRSPLYDRLKAQGACFGEKLGWERPNWFADLARGEKAEDRYSYERQNWFDAVGREHTACRERVAVFDQTSFAKFMLVGRDAEAALSWICANDVAKPPGHLVYTQMLNERGGIECDLTVGRLSPTEYYIVTGTGFATHDFDWISRSIPDGLDARLIDVTSANAVLSVMGPRSRDVLQALTEHDISNAGFPFGRVRRMTVAGAPRPCAPRHLCRRARLGAAHSGRVCADRLRRADGGGRAARHRQRRLSRHRVAAPGEGLPRLGRRYRARPLAAGRRPRLGGEAEIEHAVSGPRGARGPGRKASCRACSPASPPIPRSCCSGARPSTATASASAGSSSGGYGYTVGRSIGYGYVRDPENGVDREERALGPLRARGRHRRACRREVFLDPLYDPTMSRIKS